MLHKEQSNGEDALAGGKARVAKPPRRPLGKRFAALGAASSRREELEQKAMLMA